MLKNSGVLKKEGVAGVVNPNGEWYFSVTSFRVDGAVWLWIGFIIVPNYLESMHFLWPVPGTDWSHCPPFGLLLKENTWLGSLFFDLYKDANICTW